MKKYIFLIITVITFSCSNDEMKKDNLIDNLILLESQVHSMNVVQFDIGNGYKSDVHSEIATTPKNQDNSMKLSKIGSLYIQMENIDKRTFYLIKLIDQIKMDLLKTSGEDISKIKDLDPSTIIWKKYDTESDQGMPMKLNLNAIANKEESEFVNSYFIDDLKPSSKGMELWNALNSYRNKLVEIVGTYHFNEHTFSIKPININSFINNKDLVIRVEKMVDGSKANLKEDRQVLIDLYKGITKQNPIKKDGKSVHWIYATFNNASLIGALSSLTSIQQDILSSRRLALAHSKSKFSSCGYGFDTIMPIAVGPSTGFVGEKVELKVFMAAFDSYNQPVVTTNFSNATIKYPLNGTGIVTLIPKKGLQTIRGTVTIRNKSGTPKTEDWEWIINGIEKD